MLYRESYYQSNPGDESGIDITELIITKQRNGPIGTVELKFDTLHTKFLNSFSEE